MTAMNTALQIHQRGFTLIELLSTLAILSIVMVMAIPTYNDYKTRAKISDGISMVGEVLLRVSETYQMSGIWPNTNSKAGVAESSDFATKWVNKIVVEHDASDKTQIRVVYNNATIRGIALDDDIIFKPIEGGGNTRWDCIGGTIATYYRPRNCRVSNPS